MRLSRRMLAAAAGLLLAGYVAAQAPDGNAQAILERAVADFLDGRIAESVTGFDRVAELVPAAAPQLWQRGIALFYAGRYQDCRAQFESHRTVNPNDVENAAWHFLCVARLASAAGAREALLPAGPDPRRPMRVVYEMLRGEVTPDAVLAAAGDEPRAQFYAALYVGLYYDALGDRTRALQHITTAAEDRFAAAGGYMHAVARIHRASLEPPRE